MIKIVVTQTGRPDAIRWYARVPVKGDLVTVDGTPGVVLAVRLYGQDKDPAGRPDILTNLVQASVHVGPPPSLWRRIFG